MNSVIDSASARSRTILATLLLVLVSGTVAYVEIPKESDPDISIPIIYVRVSFDGISPEDSERLLIRPMEAELRVIEGLKEMRSSGYEGGASVVLEFEAGFDADAAMDEVREQVDLAKPELPDGADEPTVHEVNLSLFPVLVVILSGDVPERTLLRLARELRDAVEGISSVLAAEIAGDREDLVEVIVDPVRIESYGLSAVEAIAAVRNNNLVVAAGTQDTGRGRFSIKVPGLFEAVEDILDMPLVVRGDAVVTVRDIAEVRSAFVDAKGFARAEGRPAVALEVSKRAGENIIGTIARVPRRRRGRTRRLAGFAAPSGGRELFQGQIRRHPHDAGRSQEQRDQRRAAGDDRGRRGARLAHRRLSRHRHPRLVPDRNPGCWRRSG